MSTFDILTKPLKIDPKLFTPAPSSTYKSFGTKPLSISSLISPLPKNIIDVAQKAKPTEQINMTMMPIQTKLPTPIKTVAQPLPASIIETAKKTAERVPDYMIRKQDFRDVGNLPST